MRKYTVEFIGTFFLVLTVGLCLTGPSAYLTTADNHCIAHPLVPAAIGMALAMLIYAGANISGGHYNPFVSLAFALRGAMEKRDLLPYAAAQSLGGIAAIFTTRFLVGPGNLLETVPPELAPADLLRSFTAEVLFTFALIYIALQVATTRKAAGNGYYGIVIGGVVMVAIVAVGPISGAVLNPVIALAFKSWNLLPMQQSLVNVGGQLAGALAAVGVFRLTNKEDIA